MSGERRARLPSAQETPVRMAAVGALVLVASFVNYLTHNGYPLPTPEVGLVSLGLLGVAALAGAAYAVAGRRMRAALIALLCFSAVQINFDGGLVVTALTLALLLLGRVRVALLTAVAVAMLVSALATGGSVRDAAPPEPAVADSGSGDLPVLLHLIVDEHIGIDAFPAGHADLQATRDQAIAFYGEHGFRLFTGAYSRFNNTVNALPAILNFGEIQPWAPDHLDGIDVAENAYFERLDQLGFDLTVYESDYVGYCGQAAVDRCVVYGINDLSAVAASELLTLSKASILAYGFSSLSGVAIALTNLYDNAALHAGRSGWFDLPYVELEARGVFSSVSASGAFDRLIADLRHARPGQAYFAHMLVPHYPYVLAEDCRLKPIGAWGLRHSRVSGLADRQRAYAEQVRCVTRKVAAAVAALEQSPGGRRTIVVVHGDHGSRLTEVDPTIEALDRFSDEDVIASHATLFAVRADGIAGGLDDRRLPVWRLLKSLADSAFGSIDVELPGGFVPNVMLVRKDAEPVRPYPLPGFGAAD